MYIIRNLLRYIINAKHCISSSRRRVYARLCRDDIQPRWGLMIYQACGLDKKEVTFGRQKLLLFWSRVRESNPPSRLGKPLYYRYTNPAFGGIIAGGDGKCKGILGGTDSSARPTGLLRMTAEWGWPVLLHVSLEMAKNLFLTIPQSAVCSTPPARGGRAWVQVNRCKR